jgi:hypothetical protein
MNPGKDEQHDAMEKIKSHWKKIRRHRSTLMVLGHLGLIVGLLIKRVAAHSCP